MTHIDTPPSTVDETAPVVVRREARIEAPIDLVWRLHTDVAGWPAWQTDIATAQLDGPLVPGATFRWTTHGLDIASTVYAVDAPRRILWGGPAQGITGVHEWTFTADGDATIVRTAESWEGEPVRADPDALRTALEASLGSWLDSLRTTAEAATRAT
ncbi:SRPBCC family protein [Cellulomonas sp. NPDC055163]